MARLSLFVPLLVFAISNVYGQLGMAGGRNAQNPNDPSYMARAWRAAKNVNDASNSPYMMIPIRVVSAQSQVVAGVNHHMQIVYGESTCARGQIAPSAVSAASCQLRPNGNRALYNVVSYERAWENYEQFTVTKIRDLAPGEQI